MFCTQTQIFQWGSSWKTGWSLIFVLVLWFLVSASFEHVSWLVAKSQRWVRIFLSLASVLWLRRVLDFLLRKLLLALWSKFRNIVQKIRDVLNFRYCKIGSSRLLRLVANQKILRLFMKRNFDGYLLWQNCILWTKKLKIE